MFIDYTNKMTCNTVVSFSNNYPQIGDIYEIKINIIDSKCPPIKCRTIIDNIRCKEAIHFTIIC